MSVKHPEFVLAGAVVVCLPMVPPLLHSEMSVDTAATRFLIALIVCWILGSVVSWAVRTYGEQAARTEMRRAIEGDPNDGEQKVQSA